MCKWDYKNKFKSYQINKIKRRILFCFPLRCNEPSIKYFVEIHSRFFFSFHLSLSVLGCIRLGLFWLLLLRFRNNRIHGISISKRTLFHSENGGLTRRNYSSLLVGGDHPLSEAGADTVERFNRSPSLAPTLASLSGFLDAPVSTWRNTSIATDCPLPERVLKDFGQSEDLGTNLQSAQSILGKPFLVDLSHGPLRAWLLERLGARQ